MKTFEDNDVINGSWGEVWVDNDYMAQATALEATIKFTKTDVPQTGRLNSGKKVTGIEGSGTLKLNHASSYFKKKNSDRYQKWKKHTMHDYFELR